MPSDLEPLVLRHRVAPAELRSSVATVGRIGSRHTVSSRNWIGVNPARIPTDYEYAVFVVDAHAAYHKASCTANDDSYTCQVLGAAMDNCVAAAPGWVVCGDQFIAALRIAAFAMITARVMASQKQPFSVIAGTFESFDGMLSAPGRLKKVAQLDALAESHPALKAVRPLRESAEVGFVEFVLLHEFGHLEKGHATGAVLPACAMPTSKVYTDGGAAHAREIEADEYALKEIEPPTPSLNAAYFAPVLFETLHTLMLARAHAQAGVQFSDSAYRANLTKAKLSAVAAAYKRLACKTSHPYLTSRYFTFVESPKYAGVSYSLDSGMAREQKLLSFQFCAAA